MKKYQYLKSLVIIIVILSSTLIYSAPIQNYPIKLTQPDGSEIDCFLSGDEYFNYYHTEDGYFIKKGSDGYYYFANQEHNNDIYTTNYRIDSYNPSKLGINKWLKPNISEINTQIDKKQAKYKKFDNENLQYKLEGTLNNLVIFIRFADDEEYTDSFQFYDSLLNDKNNMSMRNYYLEASYNNFDIVSHIYPTANTTIVSYQDNKKREYYVPYDQYTNPKGYRNNDEKTNREFELIARAIKFVAPQIPKDINLDMNEDGYVDNINFIIKGDPTAWSTLLWPHAFIDYLMMNTINDLLVGMYNINLSNLTTHSSHGLGTICHEFFHSLGCPDMYHYSYDGKVALGRWELMDQTTNPPQMMCNFLKSQYTGWIEDIPLITKEGKYELKPTSSPTGSIYKIKTNNSLTEYFILEYRKKEGFYDGMLPNSGLLVYRVDSSLSYRGNGYGPPDEIYLYRPNGTMQEGGNLVNASFCKEDSRTSIGENTNPQLFLTNGRTAGIEIYNISECGETISFEVSYTIRTAFIEPAKQSVDVELNPRFVWRYIAEAKLYSIEIASDYDFNDIVFKLYEFDATAIKLGDILQRGKTYYARVRWSNDSKTSAWSDVLEFSTIQAPPKLIYPANGSNEISIKPKFNWNENSNTNYYKVQVSETPDFAKIDFSKSLLKDTIIEATKVLKLNTKYYWRVVSRSLSGKDTESEIYSFTTKENDLVIGSFSDSEDVCAGESITIFAEVQGSTANYKWYRNNKELIGQNNSTLTIENFTNEDKGSYECIAYNDELGVSCEFPMIKLNIINFATFDYIPRKMQVPSQNNVLLRLNIDGDFATLYNTFKFQWYKNDEKLSNGNNYTGVNTTILAIVGGLKQNIDSIYRVQVISRCGDTLNTEYYSILANVEDNTNFNNDIIVYPNPTREQFVISFNSEGLPNVNLKIYNSYGEIVYSENNILSTGGLNEITMSSDKLAVGTYFIEIYSGNTIKRQKFVVIK